MAADSALQSCSMPRALLPALPADVLGCIAHAALAAEDSDVRAWNRLSAVCRAWRESLRGAQPAPVLLSERLP